MHLLYVYWIAFAVAWMAWPHIYIPYTYWYLCICLSSSIFQFILHTHFLFRAILLNLRCCKETSAQKYAIFYALKWPFKYICTLFSAILISECEKNFSLYAFNSRILNFKRRLRFPQQFKNLLLPTYRRRYWICPVRSSQNYQFAISERQAIAYMTFLQRAGKHCQSLRDPLGLPSDFASFIPHFCSASQVSNYYCSSLIPLLHATQWTHSHTQQGAQNIGRLSDEIHFIANLPPTFEKSVCLCSQRSQHSPRRLSHIFCILATLWLLLQLLFFFIFFFFVFIGISHAHFPFDFSSSSFIFYLFWLLIPAFIGEHFHK